MEEEQIVHQLYLHQQEHLHLHRMDMLLTAKRGMKLLNRLEPSVRKQKQEMMEGHISTVKFVNVRLGILHPGNNTFEGRNTSMLTVRRLTQHTVQNLLHPILPK